MRTTLVSGSGDCGFVIGDPAILDALHRPVRDHRRNEALQEAARDGRAFHLRFGGGLDLFHLLLIVDEEPGEAIQQIADTLLRRSALNVPSGSLELRPEQSFLRMEPADLVLHHAPAEIPAGWYELTLYYLDWNRSQRRTTDDEPSVRGLIGLRGVLIAFAVVSGSLLLYGFLAAVGSVGTTDWRTWLADWWWVALAMIPLAAALIVLQSEPFRKVEIVEAETRYARPPYGLQLTRLSEPPAGPIQPARFGPMS